jgi:hypothetical protein
LQANFVERRLVTCDELGVGARPRPDLSVRRNASGGLEWPPGHVTVIHIELDSFCTTAGPCIFREML